MGISQHRSARTARYSIQNTLLCKSPLQVSTLGLREKNLRKFNKPSLRPRLSSRFCLTLISWFIIHCLFLLVRHATGIQVKILTPKSSSYAICRHICNTVLVREMRTKAWNLLKIDLFLLRSGNIASRVWEGMPQNARNLGEYSFF